MTAAPMPIKSASGKHGVVRMLSRFTFPRSPFPVGLTTETLPKIVASGWSVMFRL